MSVIIYVYVIGIYDYNLLICNLTTNVLTTINISTGKSRSKQTIFNNCCAVIDNKLLLNLF